MEKKTFELLTKAEVKAKYTAESIAFDVALKAHMDKLNDAVSCLENEIKAVKEIAKKQFGKNGGNGVFRTETRESYLLNTDELIELIGIEKYNALKNKLSEKTYVLW